MILSICPNPSIDCTLELDSLNVGMLNRVQSKIETYSGKALNVAKGVSRLGEQSFVTGFMFTTHAKLFENSLEKDGVNYKFIYNEGSARTNYKIIDKKSMLTEINDKGGFVSREKQLELINYVKSISSNVNVAVMSGSLPVGVDPEFYNEVMSIFPNSVKKIVDTEAVNLEHALKTELFMVKPNLRELESFVGSTLYTKNDIIKACYKLLSKGVKYVLVSLGADGAVLTDGTYSYYCKSASVAVNSTVGAGDCMVAAACVELMKGSSMEEMLKSCVAAGTAAITTSGTNLFEKAKYDEIYSKIMPVRVPV
ncbi:MAG: 1-phosphofructokinase family hexose kinase [Clostridia bacterium]|nr:1-phosphofructokinase family hexose kinase [Clostridia bacterium]